MRQGAAACAALLWQYRRFDLAQSAALAQFADDLGLAFQIADDIQDGIQDEGDVTNILHYQTPEEAAGYARTRLEKSTQALATQFDAAGALVAIAHEVLNTL